MGIDFVIKVAVIGIVVGLLYQLLAKAGKEEYTTVTTIAGLILVVAMLLPKLDELITELTGMFGL